MRLISLLLTICVFCAYAADTHSQNARVSIHKRIAPLDEILNEIESQTDYLFVYNNQVNVNRKVSLRVKGKPVSYVLSHLLRNTDIDYSMEGTHIVLSKRGDITRTQQATRRISGLVTDVTGEPIIGANVVEKGTSNGTITATDGKFTLEVSSGAVLSVSFIGYITREINPGNQTSLVIELTENTQALDEVVVIGYGAVRKSDLTGSVSSVKSEDLTKMATASPVAALQGRAAGVLVVQESGSPDATAAIKIRGIGTTNNADPLYVVDGFPMGDINYLNPTDIEALEILKDASACAIYGSRGANGVVLITTKKGKSGALKVQVNAYDGIENLANRPQMLNSQEYATLSNEAYANAGQDPLYANTGGLPDTDWFKEVSRVGKIQNYNISLSGGGDRITSLFSANYYRKDGIIRSTDYAKYSFAQNNTMKVGNFLNLSTSLSAVFTDFKNFDPTSIFLSSLIAPPDISVINPETDYYSGISKIRLGNPAGRIARNNDKNRRTYLVGNFNAEVNLMKDLNFNSRFGIRHDGSYNSGFTPVYYETMDNSESINTVRRSTSRMIDWTLENILTYRRNFSDVHEITAMAAISAREYNRDQYDVTKQNVPIEKEEYWYFNSATDNPQANGTGASLAMLSYLGRINYNFKNRYLLTGSIRSDGSSRFIGSNRWGVFPSAALAWKLSEESFFKNLDLTWLNNVKVRLGYGELGNENIDSYYPYLTPITQRQYYTLGSGQVRLNGSGLSGIGNAEAQWETSTQSNAGLDLMFLNGKMEVTVDYYIRKTNDILLSQQIPQISGSSSIVRNVGGLENKGFEFAISYKESLRDFSYNVNLNLATVKNKVVNLGTSGSLISSFAYDYVLIDFQGALGNMIRSEVGKPYGQFYGYQTDHIFRNQAEIDRYTKDGAKIQPEALPGDFKFKDLNDNGRIDDGDMTFIGNPIPDITYGLSLDAQYKRFDLNLLFQGVWGNDIYNAAKYYFVRFDGRQNVRADYMDAYWRGENSSASLPIVTQDLTRNTRNYRNSDFYIEDGSYLRLKTMQLGYNHTPSSSIRAVIPSFRIYLAMQNLFTVTRYSGFEPEVSTISVDRGQYPQSRSFLLGMVLNF
ncbi:MAG: TonB-dependent receptor [Tannerellaceae bacterium]|nr:TonB-dependent receptor [Tannerellaceae bacterium]